MVPKLQTNLAVYKFLRLHPGAPPQQWPGELSWAAITGYFFDSEWKTGQQNVILEHMPHAEVRRDAELYARLDLLNQQFQQLARSACSGHNNCDAGAEPGDAHIGPDRPPDRPHCRDPLAPSEYRKLDARIELTVSGLSTCPFAGIYPGHFA